jgi:hypothetical protein
MDKKRTLLRSEGEAGFLRYAFAKYSLSKDHGECQYETEDKSQLDKEREQSIFGHVAGAQLSVCLLLGHSVQTCWSGFPTEVPADMTAVNKTRIFFTPSSFSAELLGIDYSL